MLFHNAEKKNQVVKKVVKLMSKLTGQVAFLSECITTCIFKRRLEGNSLSQIGQTIPHWLGCMISKCSTKSVIPLTVLSHLLQGHSRSSVQDGLPRPRVLAIISACLGVPGKTRLTCRQT